MIKYKMNWNTSHLHSQVNGSFSHQEAKKCGGVGEVEVLRTLALGIDVKWGCPSNTTSCVHGHTYWICVNFLLRGLSWECLLLESEVWGQIRFLKGTGNGGWSMKTKFYPKSMDPHWMRVYVGVHSLYFDTKLQAPVNRMDAKKSMLSISMFMHQSHFWSGHWKKILCCTQFARKWLHWTYNNSQENKILCF